MYIDNIALMAAEMGGSSPSQFSQVFSAVDTMIQEGNPNSIYGSATSLSADQNTSGGESQILIKFPELTNTLPVGTVSVTSARLTYLVDNPGNPVAAYRVLQPWTDTITWNGSFGGNGVDLNGIEGNTFFSFTDDGTTGFKTRDVTGDVASWLAGSVENQGWVLISSGWNGWDIESAEGIPPPQLEVQYSFLPTNEPTPAPIATPQPTPVPVFTAPPSPRTFSAVDTMIQEGNPNSSYEAAGSLNADLATSGGESQVLIKFPGLLNELGVGSVSVTSATLTYDVVDPGDDVSAYRVLQPWIDTITWNGWFGGNGVDQNGIESAATASFTDDGSTGVKVQDVTADVVAWLSGAVENEGWVLVSSGGNGWDIESAEGNPPPQLEVLYTSSAPTPVGPTPSTPGPPVPSSPLFFFAEDTMIEEANPGSSYGNALSLNADLDSGGGEAQILIKFPELLNELPVGSVSVTSATLSYEAFDPGDEVSAYRVLQPWTDAITWNGSFGGNGVDQDGIESAVFASFTDDGTTGFKTQDVTNDVTAWLSGAFENHGWALISFGTGGWDIRSAESFEPPQLRVEFTSLIPTISPAPTPDPTSRSPTLEQTCDQVSYFPGDLTKPIQGFSGSIVVSTGLSGRVLTQVGSSVQFDSGGGSGTSMHSRADGAAVVPDDSNSDRYFYVSNSESGTGGVGILHFDSTTSPHSVIGYTRAATSTSSNCGGGRTPWGTWLTSEESGSSGRVWEVDPNQGGAFCRSAIVEKGANYESNAFWEANDGKWHFYTTIDSSSNYLLTRFVPNDTRAQMLSKSNKLDRLCTESTSPDSTADNEAGQMGQHTYLVLTCTSGCNGDTPSGTYVWSTNPGSSTFNYGNTEGIDVKGNQLFFVSKTLRRVYIAELDGNNTWRAGATIQNDAGSTFSPDQVARITGSNSPNDILYFCEDGSGNQDIHARGLDENGDYRFFTIIRGYDGDETTGLSFSPDNKYMYFAHQSNSEIWQIWREDGCSFGDGNYIDIKYHQHTPFRKLMLRGVLPTVPW